MPKNQTQISFGLMPVSDAVPSLPRTVLPLKSVRYAFVARAGLAEVEMTQVYAQENPQPLDCEYLFPLPADAAVYRCEAIINGRVIRARIEEREAARQLAAEKKAAGHRTALVESERDNLFTLTLGNVQPGDVVEVKLAYLQPLRRLNREVSLDLPLCPGVRYIPGQPLLRSNRGRGVQDDTDQVPDASHITPPRIDEFHPDAAFIELDGQLDASFFVGQVHSPSHQLAITNAGDLLHLALAQGGEVPDRDLALRWKEQEPAQTALRGWTSQDDRHGYALIELRAPAVLPVEDALPQDVYFLVDRSGSMAGEKWHKAIAALHQCIRVLGARDRVWITFFESTFQDFGSEPAAPAALTSDPRFRALVTLGTAGGTEMAPALQHVLGKVQQHSPNRPAVLVLITDAEIGNERDVVSLMRGHPSLPVHCFGIDTTLNDSLLLDLVRQQGGTFHALQPHEDVAGRVAQLGRTLRQPVLLNLQPPAGWQPAAGAIPNLYAGQIHLVSLQAETARATDTLQLSARDHHNQEVKLAFHLAPVTDVAPRLRWCKERLTSLVAQDRTADAIALSKESNLLCPFTAFVAWDEHEQVTVASHVLVQPAMEPEYAAGAFAQRAGPASSAVRAAYASGIRFCMAERAVSPLPPASALACLADQLAEAPSDPLRAQLVGRIQMFLELLAASRCQDAFKDQFEQLQKLIFDAPDSALASIETFLNELDPLVQERSELSNRLGAFAHDLADTYEGFALQLRQATHRDLSRLLQPGVAPHATQQLETLLSEAERLEHALSKRIASFLADPLS